MKCKFCNKELKSKFSLEEKMFQTNEEFEYFECDNCKSLQISTIPLNLENYYPKNYYSFSKPKIRKSFKEKTFNLLITHAIKYRFNKNYLIGSIINIFLRDSFSWITEDIKSFDAKVLDVGTGSGGLLFRMQEIGFTNLHGIDPFIEKNINSRNICVQKKNLESVSETYDVVMLHHVIEHVTNPVQDIKHINRILNDNGVAIIITPIYNNYAWRKYGSNWVQLDVPRHLNIFTVSAMKHILNDTELKISEVFYNSNSFQFLGSEKYIRGLKLSDTINFKKANLKEFKKKAKKLNLLNDGDTACFILKKIKL
jgi:SAM-dependent methyltransferase